MSIGSVHSKHLGAFLAVARLTGFEQFGPTLNILPGSFRGWSLMNALI